MPSGEIAAANADAGELLVFDAEGRFLRSIGGKGQGPGEYTWINGFDVWADSLILSDSQLQRVTVLDARMNPNRTLNFGHDLPTAIEQVSVLGPDLWGVRGFAAVYPPAEPGSTRQDTVGFGYMRPDSATWTRITSVPGMVTAAATIDGRWSYRPIAFTPEPMGATLGRCWVVGSGDSAELSIWTPGGERLRTLVVGLPLRETTPEDHAAWIDDLLEGLPEEAARWQRRFLEALPYPDFFPVIHDVVVDERGFVWVQEGQAPWGASRYWRVIDPTAGREVARVEMPVSGKILDIRTSGILVRGVTSLDEQYLIVFSSSRPEAEEDVVPPECRSRVESRPIP
ncbi:MAG: 6-bladed beta-propeller [Longimicrobiales bacterium]